MAYSAFHLGDYKRAMEVNTVYSPFLHVDVLKLYVNCLTTSLSCNSLSRMSGDNVFPFKALNAVENVLESCHYTGR